MYAQVISDDSGRTFVAVSTRTKGLGDDLKTGTVEAAKKVGAVVAERCRAEGIDGVVFDRNGFLYHGRVRAVAEGAREGGLQL